MIALIFTVNVVMSQDIIKTMYGNDLNVKVTEITKEEVKYTKAEDLNTKYSIRIVKVDRILFEDGTVKIFGGTLDFQEEKDGVVVVEATEIEEKPEEPTKDKIVEVIPVTKNKIGLIPSEVYAVSGKGAKVFLKSRDNNAAIHAKRYIEEWGYWQVTPDVKKADFILTLDVRFQAPMDFWIKANFIDKEANATMYTSQEYRAEKGNRDPNKKRAAVKHVFDKVFTANFK